MVYRHSPDVFRLATFDFWASVKRNNRFARSLYKALSAKQRGEWALAHLLLKKLDGMNANRRSGSDEEPCERIKESCQT
jgi:hypothetical protein